MMPFRLYEVELKRTSYVTYVVEALDESAAEEVALDLLSKDGSADNSEAEWDVNNVWRYEP